MTDDGPTYEVAGLDNLVRTLKRAGGDINDLKDAHKRAGQIVQSAAAARAPRLSGALAGSIKSARQQRRARVTAGGARVPYGPAIHWGWPARNIAANPFISEAAQDTESEWRRGYEHDVQKAVDNVRGI